jgi:hypothetical protein
MYVDYDKLSHAQRIRSFRDAQEKILTLNTSADLNDKTYAQQLKGAAILEPISKRMPRHPGGTHYLIHLYDYPALAAKGLDAANHYASIAPAVPHAQHMPSHIYTRVGYWKQSVDSNAASVKAAKAEKSVGNYLHAQDYMVYAHLQLGQDKQAGAVIDEMMQETDFKAAVRAAHYALAASPARFAVERGDWVGASQLPVRPSPFNFVTARRSGPRAPAGRISPRLTSPSSPNCATSFARPRTAIGPRSSTSSGRSRLPGCFTRKASMTKR